MNIKTYLALGALAALNATSAVAQSGAVAATPEETARRQARSVHLRYASPTPKVSGAAVTVTVRESYPGTYFMALGWSCGYCGLQELPDGRHVLIFSVWDPVDPFDFSAKPENVRVEHRAKVIYADPLLDVARFGGEGTGARTMAGYGWKVGEPVRFRIEAEPDGSNRTAFTCLLQDASTGEGWHRLATISTMNRDGEAPGLDTLHSFVEDFRRDYDSATRVRRAEFSGVVARSVDDGKWHPIVQARFTGDSTPSSNVDAGRVEGNPGAFFLATGGTTQNNTTRLWSEIR